VTARDGAAGPPEPQTTPARTQAPRTQRPETGPRSAGQPSYEQARDELTELVKRLEAGGLTLEQSLELWERGERLASICTDWLEGARARLAAATAQRSGEDGDPAAPF
jgi:exodeoxyribonuclease VII small subunit